MQDMNTKINAVKNNCNELEPSSHCSIEVWNAGRHRQIDKGRAGVTHSPGKISSLTKLHVHSLHCGCPAASFIFTVSCRKPQQCQISSWLLSLLKQERGNSRTDSIWTYIALDTQMKNFLNASQKTALCNLITVTCNKQILRSLWHTATSSQLHSM